MKDISLLKMPVDEMIPAELGKKRHFTFANLFQRRLNNIVGKRKKASINVDVQIAIMFNITQKKRVTIRMSMVYQVKRLLIIRWLT